MLTTVTVWLMPFRTPAFPNGVVGVFELWLLVRCSLALLSSAFRPLKTWLF
jgi:hypothetical protein